MPNNEAEMHLQSTFDPDALPIYPQKFSHQYPGPVSEAIELRINISFPNNISTH